MGTPLTPSASAASADSEREIALIAPHFEWDTATWSRALTAWLPDLIAREQAGQPLRCLEVGARRCGLSAWLASRGHHCVATDLTLPERPNHAGSGTIETAVLDIVNESLADRFDIVVVKSVLGSVRAMHGEDAVHAAVANLRKMAVEGGAIWFAENLQASPLHQFLRSRFIPWADRWHYFTTAELSELMTVGSATSTFDTTGFLAAFGRSETQRDLLASVDARLDPMAPAGAKYVGYGVTVVA